MWRCVCGHHRANHPWAGYGPYGTKSGYSGCRLCAVCEKPDDEHYFITHHFERCSCREYQETA